jgi:hypothetical protein
MLRRKPSRDRAVVLLNRDDAACVFDHSVDLNAVADDARVGEQAGAIAR